MNHVKSSKKNITHLEYFSWYYSSVGERRSGTHRRPRLSVICSISPEGSLEVDKSRQRCSELTVPRFGHEAVCPRRLWSVGVRYVPTQRRGFLPSSHMWHLLTSSCQKKWAFVVSKNNTNLKSALFWKRSRFKFKADCVQFLRYFWSGQTSNQPLLEVNSCITC